MKKIVIAFDGTQFSEGAFELARQLNELGPLLLTGVFVPLVNFANLWSYGTAMAGPDFIPMLEEEESELIHRNIKKFEELCQLYGIKYRVHKDFFDLALPELKEESRFADMLIISSEKFYENMRAGSTNEYIEDAIHYSECPVLVVPETYEFPKRNILAYDGSFSSVYAIKQFAYLLPDLCKNESLLLFIKDDKTEKIPYEDNIKELATLHYPNLLIEKLHINPKKYFTTWMSEAKNSLLISGALGRTALSQLFHKSFVSEIISTHKLPVFIAHK